jgi:signal transduction histidine kinase
MDAGKELVIVLRDDGIGFDRAAIRPYANGLQNMERRIGELGGTLRIESRPLSGGASAGEGRGTTVTISAPL